MIEALSKQLDERSQGAQNKRDTLQIVTLRLPGELIRKLDRIAEDHGYSSRSDLVRQLLILSLSGKTLELEQMQKAAEQFFLPVLSKVSELLKEIVEEIPKQKLLELVGIALIPFAQFVSATMGIPASQIEEGIREPLADIIGRSEGKHSKSNNREKIG